MADPTDPCLFVCPSGVGCYQKTQTIRVQGTSFWLACKLNGKDPRFLTSTSDIHTGALPKWLQRGSSLSSLSSESSSGCICSVDIIKGGRLCVFIPWHYRSMRYKFISMSSVHAFIFLNEYICWARIIMFPIQSYISSLHLLLSY